MLYNLIFKNIDKKLNKLNFSGLIFQGYCLVLFIFFFNYRRSEWALSSVSLSGTRSVYNVQSERKGERHLRIDCG